MSEKWIAAIRRNSDGAEQSKEFDSFVSAAEYLDGCVLESLWSQNRSPEGLDAFSVLSSTGSLHIGGYWYSLNQVED